MTFVRALRREERAIATNALPLGPWPGDSGNKSWSGSSVTNETAMQLATVYGCVKFITDGISTLPIDVYREVGGVPEPVAQPGWLWQPTVYLDRVAWMSQILTSLLMSGNAFLHIRREGVTIRELVPMDPTGVQVRMVAGRKQFVVGSTVLDTFDVLHIPGIMAPGSLVGMSPLEAARQVIGSGLAAEKFAGKFFGQGLSMSGVIEVPGSLNPDKAKELAKAFAKQHSGTERAFLPGVLEGGATWRATSVSAEQAQFLQTRKFTDSVIAGRIFNIDPTELGIPLDGTTLTYQNAVDRNTRKAEVTFLPWIVRIESGLSSLLPAPRYVKIDLDALKRGDTKTRYETYQIGISAGFLTADEARDSEDMPPLGAPVVQEPPDPIGDPVED